MKYIRMLVVLFLILGNCDLYASDYKSIPKFNETRITAPRYTTEAYSPKLLDATMAAQRQKAQAQKFNIADYDNVDNSTASQDKPAVVLNWKNYVLQPDVFKKVSGAVNTDKLVAGQQGSQDITVRQNVMPVQAQDASQLLMADQSNASNVSNIQPQVSNERPTSVVESNMADEQLAVKPANIKPMFNLGELQVKKAALIEQKNNDFGMSKGLQNNETTKALDVSRLDSKGINTVHRLDSNGVLGFSGLKNTANIKNNALPQDDFSKAVSSYMKAGPIEQIGIKAKVKQDAESKEALIIQKEVEAQFQAQLPQLQIRFMKENQEILHQDNFDQIMKKDMDRRKSVMIEQAKRDQQDLIDQAGQKESVRFDGEIKKLQTDDMKKKQSNGNDAKHKESVARKAGADAQRKIIAKEVEASFPPKVIDKVVDLIFSHRDLDLSMKQSALVNAYMKLDNSVNQSVVENVVVETKAYVLNHADVNSSQLKSAMRQELDAKKNVAFQERQDEIVKAGEKALEQEKVKQNTQIQNNQFTIEKTKDIGAFLNNRPASPKSVADVAIKN